MTLELDIQTIIIMPKITEPLNQENYWSKMLFKNNKR